MAGDPPKIWAPHLWSIALLVLLRFVLAGFMPVVSDASLYLSDARVLARDPRLLFDLGVGTPPPLFLVLAAALAPVGDIALKLLTPLFGAAAVYFTYRLGRDLGGEAAGRWAALLLAAFPAHLFYSTVGYLDAPAAGMVAASLYALHRALRVGGRWIWLAGLMVGLAALTKASALPLFFVLLLYPAASSLHRYLKRPSRERGLLAHLDRRALGVCLAVLVIGGAVAGPYYGKNFLQGGNPLRPPEENLSGRGGIPGAFTNREFYLSVKQPLYNPASSPLDYLAAAYWEAWGFPGGRLELTPSFIPAPLTLAYAGATLLMSGLAVAGFARSLRRTRPVARGEEPSAPAGSHALLWLYLLAWLVPTVVSSENVFFGFRRMLPLAPVLALLAVPGFTPLARPGRKLLLVLVFLILAAGVASQAAKVGVAWRYSEEKRPLLEALRSLPQESVVLVADDDLVRYYSEKRSRPLHHLDPGALNASVLRFLNVTHVVRDENYLFYDLSAHNRAIDRLAGEGTLRVRWEESRRAVYEVARP